MTKFLMIATVLVAGVALCGCETVKGVGRDITHSSETVQGWF